MITKNSKIFLAGHKGLIGSAILRKLRRLKYKKIFTIERAKLDLRDQKKVNEYLRKIRPDGVIIAAAKVGGIKANNELRANFIFDNLSIQNNIIDGSYRAGVKNLIFLGSSCVYPKNCKKPIKEKYLLSNYLEKTNEPYAIAKIAGISLTQSYNFQYNLNYKCLMPCNSYGINDNYETNSSHFFPALIRKLIESKRYNKDHIKIWGSGKPLRELIYSDDIADACVFFLKKKTKETLINIGTGHEKSITNYAKFIMKNLKIKKKIIYEKKKLEGTYSKLLDVSLAKKYGWKNSINLKTSIKMTYKSFLTELNV